MNGLLNRHGKISKKARGAEALAERGEIATELKKLQDELDRVQNQLDYATDEALIDSYIYEIRSLNMRYTYFLNLCKKAVI